MMSDLAFEATHNSFHFSFSLSASTFKTSISDLPIFSDQGVWKSILWFFTQNFEVFYFKVNF